MAGAFKFGLGRQPAGRASQVGANRQQRIHAVVVADHPDALRLFIFLGNLTGKVVFGLARLEDRAGFEENSGIKKTNEGQEQRSHCRSKGPPRGEAEKIAPRPEVVFAFLWCDFFTTRDGGFWGHEP